MSSTVLIPVYHTQISVTSGAPVKLHAAPINAIAITGVPVLVIAVKDAGAAGNLWSLRVINPNATDQILSHKLDQTNRLLTINLATDHSGNVITSGQDWMNYISTGGGTGLNKIFSFRVAGTISAKLSDNVTPQTFGLGADPLDLWKQLQPTHLSLSVTGQSIRYRVDGQLTTPTTGNRVLVNTNLEWMDSKFDYSHLLTNMCLIAETGTATVDYTLYRAYT